ncbi:MAG: T9SS type A sorting domain-containing protein [Chlorobi bacterium]|nr:T9SS type A sorting domain-containing protein [Chlorobiota bacterium]
MKFILFFVVVFFSINGAVISQDYQNQCSKSKILHYQKFFKADQVQYPGDETIDVTYYKLDVALDYPKRLIDGKITVSAKSVVAGLDTFFLDLQNALTTDSIKLSNTILNFTHSNNIITITLDKNYSVGEEFSVDVYYHGTPGSSGFGSFEFTTHSGEPVIWTLSEPYGASDWWPCKDTPADKADSADIWITVDKSMIPVSNGTLIDTVDNDSTHTYKWHSQYPIAQYLISLAITNYKLYTNEYVVGSDTMKLYHYNYPENATSYRLGQLDKTINMLKVFAEKFGPYPFFAEKYGHAEFSWGGAMEHQTCTSIGYYGTDIIAHELAHQWFGDKITCKDWHHIWLNEGFATYSEAVYTESKFGTIGYENSIESEMSRAKNAYGSLWVQNIKSVNEIFNSNRSYSKGAVVLHMLRGILGTEMFFDVLRAYAADPALAYGVAVTEDFQRVAESVSGLNLNYFFKEWVYGVNYPKYTIDWGYEAETDGRYSITLSIDQVKNAEPSFFTMPINIRFKTNSGDTTVTLFNDQQNQLFEFTIADMPLTMTFDPDNWILKDVSSITKTDKEEVTPYHYNLEQNYPNPFNPSTTISYELPRLTEVSLKIYDILGNEVATLIDGKKQTAGYHSVQFNAFNNGNDLSSGVYLYKLIAGDFIKIRKMMLLK